MDETQVRAALDAARATANVKLDLDATDLAGAKSRVMVGLNEWTSLIFAIEGPPESINWEAVPTGRSVCSECGWEDSDGGCNCG